MMNKTKIGIIGCGNISGIYFKAGKTFEILDIIACADINMDAARAKGAEQGVPACTVDELLANPDIEIVVNLTIPAAHGDVALAALNAGKHVHTEKPLAITREQGKAVLALAEAKGLRVGCAPDTFMGGGLQTCRQLIDDGVIGRPVAATAFMMSHGPESWHPNPDFFYQPGAGPMFDMGPYYLTALINFLGPVRRVTGSAQVSFAERTITGQNPRNGEKIKVNTPTHVTGIMDFASGAVGTIITTFDSWGSTVPRIEIYGSEGSLVVPDPNIFGGPIMLKRGAAKIWDEVPITRGYTENSRGLGVADMAHAIHENRQHRANGTMAYHVLDLMHAFHDASREDRHIMMASTCERPAALHPDARF